MKKQLTIVTLCILLMSMLAACGSNNTGEGTGTNGGASEQKKSIKIGATAGPYSDMVNKAIKPLMEEKGYKIEIVEFNDYVQPNKSLDNGSIDANLFQHIIYLNKFATDNKLELSSVISVPTAPMGLYSNTIKSIDDIKEGSSLTIANDPANLARSLLLLQDIGLVTVKEDADPATISDKDIETNVKNLKINSLEAAQLPRTLDSSDLSVVAGNFALAAGMDLTTALQLENMSENYRNVVAVRTKDIESQFAKDLKAVIESPEFEQKIDEQFQGFSKPEWMTK
ncbi:MetQ/NlpA family ABC transporter substrate-binding protein [Paenibacillus endoradicis]|uniref:MetQ/NlpA family ABC transporter substrate-binding protein n=1 Tax=Paenibacillus endoradicis TaxID=2972487 RepID=UPI0021596A0D|nr:MetQ/NlpA family ABC transporter substrate-binding protein [Paenibacillus endoradicis]MCR8657531.1 MetQ/NlpA family ABC transporter substrate-binding protein [Paenibacillus endoradicis]